MYNNMIPVQLIVLSQLDPSEYLWLSCLSKKITEDTPLQKLKQAYKPHQDDPLYQTIMDAIIRSNHSKKGDAFMCDALYELFADKIAQNRNEGRVEGENRISNLILKLISDDRTSDLERVATDPTYRQILINEYHL